MQVTLVRHAAELRKTTGSARWAALALGARVFDYAADSAPFDERQLEAEGAWLLFPGAEPSPIPERPPARLIVPDGTWQQARRMVARLPSLRSLPRLTLAPPPPNARLRQPFQREWMSTLEAIAAAYALCGEPDVGQSLLQIYTLARDAIGELRGRPYYK